MSKIQGENISDKKQEAMYHLIASCGLVNCRGMMPHASTLRNNISN
ncbi:MAG: hypothetical protein Q8858_05215 [Bacteroidota bacterium]|nr:hypothetical protein [Bacteroidota bacterium]MDP4193962.1 hypothetical protein [Bacteroidota bacterium]